jgi:hypothetical protein
MTLLTIALTYLALFSFALLLAIGICKSAKAEDAANSREMERILALRRLGE